mgnify:CR=1 FL=1|tara:strand:- start:29 stop:1171 length:1143 start_codon:yes stop_codon:yes gene_type:complete
MKTFTELKEKTLTNAEKRKREEIARAMERENPDMDMDKKMAIATATAKRVAEAGEMVRAKSADKKPELVTLPDGKRVIRMVPAQKKQVVENYGNWEHKEPVEYAKHLQKTFGSPNEITNSQLCWFNKDGFKRIVVKDEYILHASPAPHYDFIYCYVDLQVPAKFGSILAESSGSIMIDYLKGEVGARCGSLTANATTLNYVMDVVSGRVTPSKKEYEKRILSMQAMFNSGKRYTTDWWPDDTGDADPKSKYYAEGNHLNVCGCNLHETPHAKEFIKAGHQSGKRYTTESEGRIDSVGVKGYNKPKRTPGHPKKSHVVVAKDGNKVKTIRFGEQGASTAGDPKKGESDRMKMKRKSFKARHGKNIAKGKMSAAYWSDKVKW